MRVQRGVRACVSACVCILVNGNHCRQPSVLLWEGSARGAWTETPYWVPHPLSPWYQGSRGCATRALSRLQWCLYRQAHPHPACPSVPMGPLAQPRPGSGQGPGGGQVNPPG